MYPDAQIDGKIAAVVKQAPASDEAAWLQFYAMPFLALRHTVADTLNEPAVRAFHERIK